MNENNKFYLWFLLQFLLSGEKKSTIEAKLQSPVERFIAHLHNVSKHSWFIAHKSRQKQKQNQNKKHTFEIAEQIIKLDAIVGNIPEGNDKGN